MSSGMIDCNDFASGLALLGPDGPPLHVHSLTASRGHASLLISPSLSTRRGGPHPARTEAMPGRDPLPTVKTDGMNGSPLCCQTQNRNTGHSAQCFLVTLVEQAYNFSRSIFSIFSVIMIRANTNFPLFCLIKNHERASIKLTDNISLHDLSSFEFYFILTTTDKIKNAFIP